MRLSEGRVADEVEVIALGERGPSIGVQAGREVGNWFIVTIYLEQAQKYNSHCGPVRIVRHNMLSACQSAGPLAHAVSYCTIARTHAMQCLYKMLSI